MTNDIVFVVSKSRIEVELEKHGSMAAVREHYPAEEVLQDWVEGHDRQKRHLEQLLVAAPHIPVLDRSEIASGLDADLFILLGGDNHFTWCSNELIDHLGSGVQQKAVAGVVLDPKKSWGGILPYDVPLLIASLPSLERGEYALQHWTTLEAEVNNGAGPFRMRNAISEYAIAELPFMAMSRVTTYIEDTAGQLRQLGPERTSGVIVATGAGAGRGSWYNNIYRMYFDEDPQLRYTDRRAGFVFREHPSKFHSWLEAHEHLIIESSLDDHGVISPEAEKDFCVDFPMGSRARIGVSAIELPVAYASGVEHRRR